MNVLDCTLRDGGYYNSWDFPKNVVSEYLEAMSSAGVRIVELGLRSLQNKGFSGANAYTTESYLESLNIPSGLKVAVMVNAVELLKGDSIEIVLEKLFPKSASESQVDVVRVACHVHEFEAALPASNWLKEKGFIVGYNLMQVAGRSQAEIEKLSASASQYPIDALYFADSLGGMSPKEVSELVGWLKTHWKGALGIHTHDNMGLALSNTMQAISDGVTWLDATVTGMGRGPGNARTEELVIEVAQIEDRNVNLVPLMSVIKSYFQPLKNKCGWGSNPYYYISGKYGIHPTYVQEMLSDSRYSEEDILAALNHLRIEGGNKFNLGALSATREFYKDEPKGAWNPEQLFKGRDVLLLGTGPSVEKHKAALESYIHQNKPLVLALNTQSSLDQSLIDVRAACHPIRLLADCDEHVKLPQPLITPVSMLPNDVIESLAGKELLDYGLSVKAGTFEFGETCSVLPTSLVICYVLAAITAGDANRILLAGFDGYGADDPRNAEMNSILKVYAEHEQSLPVISVTNTKYDIESQSIYGM